MVVEQTSQSRVATHWGGRRVVHGAMLTRIMSLPIRGLVAGCLVVCCAFAACGGQDSSWTDSTGGATELGNSCLAVADCSGTPPSGDAVWCCYNSTCIGWTGTCPVSTGGSSGSAGSSGGGNGGSGGAGVCVGRRCDAGGGNRGGGAVGGSGGCVGRRCGSANGGSGGCVGRRCDAGSSD